jgi:hypothetical protein
LAAQRRRKLNAVFDTSKDLEVAASMEEMFDDLVQAQRFHCDEHTGLHCS